MHHSTPAPRDSTRFETALWTLVALTMLLVPFAFMKPAVDVYRTPKDVLFQTFALILFAVATAGALLSDRVAATIRANRTATILAAAGVVWAGVTTLLSLQREVSLGKPLYVFCLAVFFVAAMSTTRKRGLAALALVLVPAALNAIVAFVQSTGAEGSLITRDPTSRRMWATGFIGNPNELGGYLVLPLIASIAAAAAWPRLRWAFAALALVLAGGIVGAQSVTPVIATAAGIGAMMLLPGARILRWVGVAGLIVLVTALSVHPGARARMSLLAKTARSGQMLELTSYRLTAWGVATMMFRERPLLGVGPGVFSARFMPYKLRLDERHPEWIRVGTQNFGEAHNDHLQLLAETGLPGYLLFLAMLFVLARLSFVRRHDPPTSEREKFARIASFPAAAAFAVLALAHFPMHVTSTIVPALFLAAVCLTWSSTGTDADEVS